MEGRLQYIAARILVVIQTSRCSFSHTRIPSAYACGYPRSYSNGADACSHILGFPRLTPVGILVVIRTALMLVLIYSDSSPGDAIPLKWKVACNILLRVSS